MSSDLFSKRIIKHKKHATYLKNTLGISSSMSHELVAQLNDQHDWNSLYKISKRADQSEKERLVEECLLDLTQLLGSTKFQQRLRFLYTAPFLFNTIAHSIVNGRLDWLYDIEIIYLHYSIYEDFERPQQDPIKSVLYTDNSIISDIHRVIENPGHSNICTTYWRFGVKTYQRLTINRNVINLVIMELDSLTYNSKNKKKAINLQSKLTIGFLNHTKKMLRENGYIGTIIVQNINNKLIAKYWHEETVPTDIKPTLDYFKSEGFTASYTCPNNGQQGGIVIDIAD